LKLKYDELLSSFAFNFNLRRCATALYRQLSFRMNLSRSFIVGSAANALCGLARLLVVCSW
jgi:hypothetical protein